MRDSLKSIGFVFFLFVIYLMFISEVSGVGIKNKDIDSLVIKANLSFYDDNNAPVYRSVRISALQPLIEFESGLTKYTSFVFSYGAGFHFRVTTDNNVTVETGLFYRPNFGQDYYIDRGDFLLIKQFVKSGYRIYYNMRRRISKGKETINYSADYLCFAQKYYLYDYSEAGIAWGMQRNIHRFHFDFNIGGGLTFTKGVIKPYYLTEIKLGYIISSGIRKYST